MALWAMAAEPKDRLCHGRRMLPILIEPGLAEVRHDRGRKAGKPFRISSGNRRVYTTFAIEFEPFGEAEPELL